MTNYTDSSIDFPAGITSGPDGALWFTNSGNNSIGSITTAGVVTNYTGTGIANPLGITSGPDGALWFTNSTGNSIGSITTSGVVTNYTGPGIDRSRGITAGPDGALWFTNYGNDIHRADHDLGGRDQLHRHRHHGSARDHRRTGRRALVHELRQQHSIGSITTSGVVTNYTGTGIDRPYGITSGPTARSGSPTSATTRSGASPLRGS